MTEVLSQQHIELEQLEQRKWDLLDELRTIELAKAAILNAIRGRREIEQ